MVATHQFLTPLADHPWMMAFDDCHPRISTDDPIASLEHIMPCPVALQNEVQRTADVSSSFPDLQVVQVSSATKLKLVVVLIA
jgi:hypothetical protein